MIDYFAIGLTHALIVLAAIRLLSRADLDLDPADEKTDGKRRKQRGKREAAP